MFLSLGDGRPPAVLSWGIPAAPAVSVEPLAIPLVGGLWVVGVARVVLDVLPPVVLGQPVSSTASGKLPVVPGARCGLRP